LFGAVFHGWTAGVVYAIYGALSLFIGKGLLDLREEARILGIGWYAFSFLHSAAIAFVPALRERMVDYQRTLTPNDQEVAAIAQSMLPNLIFGLAALLSALAIWFLVRNRAAFGRAESA
jgi:mannose/fructose/N-acetylgalactosamine-specific phosphotransferase system component IID